MDLSTVQANIVTLIGTVISLLVGFAVIDNTTAQIVVSAAGTLVSVAFSLFAELRVKTGVQAKVAGFAVKGVRR